MNISIHHVKNLPAHFSERARGVPRRGRGSLPSAELRAPPQQTPGHLPVTHHVEPRHLPVTYVCHGILIAVPIRKCRLFPQNLGTVTMGKSRASIIKYTQSKYPDHEFLVSFYSTGFFSWVKATGGVRKTDAAPAADTSFQESAHEDLGTHMHTHTCTCAHTHAHTCAHTCTCSHTHAHTCFVCVMQSKSSRTLRWRLFI